MGALKARKMAAIDRAYVCVIVQILRTLFLDRRLSCLLEQDLPSSSELGVINT